MPNHHCFEWKYCWNLAYHSKIRTIKMNCPKVKKKTRNKYSWTHANITTNDQYFILLPPERNKHRKWEHELRKWKIPNTIQRFFLPIDKLHREYLLDLGIQLKCCKLFFKYLCKFIGSFWSATAKISYWKK